MTQAFPRHGPCIKWLMRLWRAKACCAPANFVVITAQTSKVHAHTLKNGSNTNGHSTMQSDTIKQAYYGDRGHALTFLDTLPLLLSLEF